MQCRFWKSRKLLRGVSVQFSTPICFLRLGRPAVRYKKASDGRPAGANRGRERDCERKVGQRLIRANDFSLSPNNSFSIGHSI